MVGVRLPTHNTLKTNKMVQEKQLRELFKYIEQKWDIAVEGSHKTDIKRIFGGVLCDDIMNDTLHEVKDEQPELNLIAEAYERGEKIRHKSWLNGDWIQKYKETKTIDNYGSINSVYPFAFIQHPEKWEIYTEPTKQPAPFDKDRFEAMFRAVVASGRTESYEQDFLATNICLEKLDAYYATKNN